MTQFLDFFQSLILGVSNLFNWLVTPLAVLGGSAPLVWIGGSGLLVIIGFVVVRFFL